MSLWNSVSQCLERAVKMLWLVRVEPNWREGRGARQRGVSQEESCTTPSPAHVVIQPHPPGHPATQPEDRQQHPPGQRWLRRMMWHFGKPVLQPLLCPTHDITRHHTTSHDIIPQPPMPISLVSSILQSPP